MTLWSRFRPKKKLQNIIEQLAFEEEEEQILLSFFFSGRKISEIGMFSCYEIQSFHNKNRENI